LIDVFVIGIFLVLMCILLVRRGMFFPFAKFGHFSRKQLGNVFGKCFWNSFFPEYKILLHNFTLVFWGHKIFLQKNE
jgi:hypothetical protein